LAEECKRDFQTQRLLKQLRGVLIADLGQSGGKPFSDFLDASQRSPI
jgi:hypothetical protein